MCGFVGYAGRNNCGAVLADGLARLGGRTCDAAGLMLVSSGKFQAYEVTHTLEAVSKLGGEYPSATVGLAHAICSASFYRSGPNLQRTAAPLRVSGYSLVFQGVVENYVALKASLLADDCHLYGASDDELLLTLFLRARRQASSDREALRQALAELEGSWSVALISEQNPQTILAAHRGSPLFIGSAEGEVFVASDIGALLHKTRSFIKLDEDYVAELSADSARLFTRSGAEVEVTYEQVSWDDETIQRRGFSHFMLKEIHEQPERLIDTLAGRLSRNRDSVILPELSTFEPARASVKRILILGCGTSWHAAMGGRYAIESIARVPVDVELAGEFRDRDPIISSDTWVIAISQSGTTADTIAALAVATARGARPMTICNVHGSTLTQMSEATIYNHAGPEIGVASTKAFTTQLATLYLFAIWLAEGRSAVSPEAAGELIHELLRIPQKMRTVLSRGQDYMDQAVAYKNATSMLYLGRNNHFPIALEGALKLKEISYIHAEGYAAGELKHGPMALVDETLPIVVISPSGSTYAKTIAAMRELKDRGCEVITVTTDGMADAVDAAASALIVPASHEALQPLLSAIPLQFFAYSIAKARGTNVDQPRNLSKSVTVE